MAASATPKRSTSRACGPRSAASAGRQIAARTRAANASRSITVPTGPTSSKSSVARAAPTCTETIPPSTSEIALARLPPPFTGVPYEPLSESRTYAGCLLSRPP